MFPMLYGMELNVCAIKVSLLLLFSVFVKEWLLVIDVIDVLIWNIPNGSMVDVGARKVIPCIKLNAYLTIQATKQQMSVILALSMIVNKEDA